MEHSLPFGPTVTEALARKIAEMAGHCREQCPEFAPAIMWCTSTRGEHFGLFAIESRYLTPDTLFAVGNVQVHVAPANQAAPPVAFWIG